MSARWIGFLLSILVGLSLGLLYGWVISPVEYVDVAPSSLRIDYQTDYVLMVAEIFQQERDVDMAAARLTFLGDSPPLERVQAAIAFARQAGYSDMDMHRLEALQEALQGGTP